MAKRWYHEQRADFIRCVIEAPYGHWPSGLTWLAEDFELLQIENRFLQKKLDEALAQIPPKAPIIMIVGPPQMRPPLEIDLGDDPAPIEQEIKS